jgi:hypothetical protein
VSYCDLETDHAILVLPDDTWGKMSIFSENITKAKVKLSLCFTKHHAMKAYW